MSTFKRKNYLCHKFIMGTRFLLVLVLLGCLTGSCVSKKRVSYFQDIESLADSVSYQRQGIRLKSDDLLSITVSAANMESVQPFNLMTFTRPSTEARATISSGTSSSGQQINYLIDSEGFINFPVLGKIKAEGSTREELRDLLEEKISEYVKDPIVNIRVLNFRVSILGEVSRPGSYTIDGERISILDAIGMAGDLTMGGKRENILVIREKDNKKHYEFIDLRSTDFFDSDYFYLQQNDIVYVEPNRAERQGAGYFNRNAGIYFSVASLLLSVMVLIFR